MTVCQEACSNRNRLHLGEPAQSSPGGLGWGSCHTTGALVYAGMPSVETWQVQRTDQGQKRDSMEACGGGDCTVEKLTRWEARRGHLCKDLEIEESEPWD